MKHYDVCVMEHGYGEQLVAAFLSSFVATFI